MSIFKSNFWIKLTHWEFWPFYVVYMPVFVYWIWLMIKSRTFFFFSTSNPTIENGGMLGESKSKIFKLIDEKWKPLTFYFKPGIGKEEFLMQLHNLSLAYPFILKPDIGERGSFVEKIDNENQLDQYLKNIKVPFLLQEYIDYEVELGIFYFRIPGESNGKVSSVVMKGFLQIIGDGKQTINELILAYPRARLQHKKLALIWKDQLNNILGNGESLVLMPIGNHCRGTTFLSGQHLINEKLNQVVDDIAKSIEGFYFGRIDVRCESIASLYSGENIKILELNGAGSEPGHIYHPGTSIITAYKSIFFHLKQLQKISCLNHKSGIPFMTFKEGMNEIFKLRAYNKVKNS